MSNQLEFDLDILGTHWKVDVGALPNDVIGQKRFGFMDARTQEITINQDVHASWRVYLLLHEMLHALSFLGHLQFLKREDFPQIDDEAKVDAIASLLAEVLTRNKLFNSEAFNVGSFEAGRVVKRCKDQCISNVPTYPSAATAAKRKS